MAKIVIVGGGAAGMMAAYAASLYHNEVILIEKNEKLGKKVFITGKGRCNVTNNCDTTEFFDSVVSNPKFLYSSLYGFDARCVMELLENHGCPLKVERGERVFPVSDHSSDVIRTMEKILNEQNVTIRKNTLVKDLIINSSQGKVQGVILSKAGETEKLFADSVILATGGYSYKTTGSDGNGHRMLEKYGLTSTWIRGGLVPLCIKEDICRELQGLSLKNVTLRLLCNGKEVYDGFGEMLFTHFGISGPLVLSASSYYNKQNHDSHDCIVEIDLKPALSEEKLDKRILREIEENKNKKLKNILPNLLPGKLAKVFPIVCNLNEEKAVNELSKEERKTLVSCMKKITLHISGTRPIDEAIITMGGIECKKINPSTMEAKDISGLYIAGELLDVDALTGGFNLQIAWSTGYLAGVSAGKEQN